MKGKIIEGKKLEDWKKKYGNKDNLEILSKLEADKDPSKLDNKKWWLIENKYYQVPKKKWLILLFCILGAGVITATVVTPIMCCKGNTTFRVLINQSIQNVAVEKKTSKEDGSYEIVIKNNNSSKYISSISKITIGTHECTADEYSFDKTNLTITINSSVMSTYKNQDIVITPTLLDVVMANSLTLSATSESTLTWTKVGDSTLQYSFTGYKEESEWTNVTSGTSITFGNTPNKMKLYLRGSLVNDSVNYNSIVIDPISGKDASVTLIGSAMDLLQDENHQTGTTLTDNCFHSLFDNSTGIVEISGEKKFLPATTLAYRCYWCMFHKCSNLKTIPANLLPATTLAEDCYMDMFDQCYKLETLPTLPAKTLAGGCYYEMFRSCKALTTLPNSYLPATDLTNCDNCYDSMFSGCKNLASIPEDLLPTGKNGSGALSPNCYTHMFENCTSLTSLPLNLLPATTLTFQCYTGMFLNCTGLTSALNLPATTTAKDCYNTMFQGCTSLEIATTGNDSEKIFTCDSAIACGNMFTNTKNHSIEFTPTLGTTYYWKVS